MNYIVKGWGTKSPNILIITDGKSQENTAPLLNQSFVKEVLVKPFTLEGLTARIEKLLSVAIKATKPKAQSKRTYGRKTYLLGEILMSSGLITEEQLNKGLEYQQERKLYIGESLVELGFITEEQKNQALSQQLGVPMVPPDMYTKAEKEVIALIPEKTAVEKRLIAVKRENDVLTVAMSDPTDVVVIDHLRTITKCEIVPMIGNDTDIKSAQTRHYQDISAEEGAHVLLSDLGEDVTFVEEEEEDVNLENIREEGSGQAIVKLVNMIIVNAIKEKVTDIHIEPQEKTLLVRYRVDGELRKVMNPPKKSMGPIISRIKILSNLDIAERRLPQDGRMKIKTKDREVDLRVSILPTINGEKAVLRLLDKGAFEKTVTNLGFTEREMDIFIRWVKRPYGLILVTGPTGSGKSTTLYAALNAVKSVQDNIITVEDPVEYAMEGINQVQINSKIQLTFAAALRSILRQDPDTVLIGEIRDQETADIAVKMSLTGHLVLSTLHTNDASGTVARYLDMGIEPMLLGSSLNLIMAQRLVKTICKHCREEYNPEPVLIERLGIEKSNSNKFYKGRGCISCNNKGYSGRTGLFELLEITPEVRKLVYAAKSPQEIKKVALSQGLKTLRDSGISKVLEGATTIDEVLAATSDV
jgi:type IV pilus assembly protein PilB